MSRVIFHLTDAQAGALIKIADGGRFSSFLGSRQGNAHASLLEALRERGFLNEWTLTPLGQAAAVLARSLATASHVGQPKQQTAGEGAP